MLQLVLLLGFIALSSCVHRQYHYIAKNKTWSEAQRFCRMNYFDLARIDNKEQQWNLTNSLNITNNKTWIGLYDDWKTWKWSLDDDAFYKDGERNYRNWYIQKPRNPGGNSLCVYYSGYDATWWERPCSYQLMFICFDGRADATDRFVMVYPNMNWTEAQSYCRQHHTDLASIRNIQENQELRFFMYTHWYYYYNYAVWIGLYRTRSWSDKSNSSFSNWLPGQPDNYGVSEYCTAASFSDSGQWSDENCMRALPFICYNGTSSLYYHFININKTWTEAQSYCRESYTDLATINKMEEMMRIVNIVNGSSYSGLAWIGLYDDLDSWRWSLDNETFYYDREKEFRGWSQEPNNQNGKELCVMMGYDGNWYDRDCNSTYQFVCYDGKIEPEEYIFVNRYMTWSQAQYYCRRHYTDLASVKNQTHNQMINNNKGYREVWIGLYRTRMWSDQHSSTYENWKPPTSSKSKEPDNGYNTAWEMGNEHCTAVSFSESGSWSDENCTLSLPFICYNRSCTGSSCSSPHLYYFVNENKTWIGAQRYCRENYTDLATINNIEEIKRLFLMVSSSYRGLAWIGLYDDLSSWKWSLDGTALNNKGNQSFKNWYIKRPRNSGGNSMCTYYTRFGIWHEDSCSTKYEFICFDGRENVRDQFVLVHQILNWTQAQSYCREHYTDLAIIRNETENEKIRLLLPTNGYYYYYNYYYNYYYYDSSYYPVWIGLYRTRSWSDKSNSSFSNWQSGQPDNSGERENCTAASISDSGQWRDQYCDQLIPFICYSMMEAVGEVASSPSRQYYFINESRTWSNAQSYCRGNYTDLATITNMEEMNNLFNLVNGTYSGLAWIGLYDDLNSWRWSLDNDTYYKPGEKDFRGWEHQPDNYYGRELCVYMDTAGNWYDLDCNSRYAFVCFNDTDNKYMRISNYMSWYEAQSYCRNQSTDLASVRNQTELQQILNVLGGYGVWIGLYRERLWSDHSSNNFTYWRPALSSSAEPDNGYYMNNYLHYQPCTAMDDFGQWTDENCFERFSFICYSETTPDAVMGVKMKIKSDKDLLNSRNQDIILMELEQELSRFGLSAANYTIYMRNIRKTSP